MTTVAKLSEEDGKKIKKNKSVGSSTLGRWVIGAMITFALVCIGLGVWQNISPTSSSGRMPWDPKLTPEQENGLLKMQLSEVGKGPPPVACPTPREWDVAKPDVVATSTGGVVTMVPQDCNGPRYVGVDAQGFTPWIRVDTKNGYRLAAESVPLSAEWSKDLRPDEDDHGYTWLRYGQVEGTTHFTSVKLTLRLVGASAK
jgi:hypothetical protein